MKKLFILLLIILSTVAGNSKNRFSYDFSIENSLNSNDSVFFSVKSLCNIRVEFLAAKHANAMINGKKYAGNIKTNKNTKGYYDFTEKGLVIFTFLFDDGKLLIVNQQYQFACEAAKIIELSKLVDDKEIVKEFAEYVDFNASLWEDINAVNDKAYYLGEMKHYDASAFILQQVVVKSPDRAVAWLNLADSLWGQDKKSEAQTAYNKYVKLIKDQNKDQKKIPERVYQRINNKK